MFEKTSADLAGIIRLSLEIDVNKYSEDSKLFVCRECFQQLTKYERAAKKLQDIKQELLSTCRNREQLREKRLAREERSRDEQHWRCASCRLLFNTRANARRRYFFSSQIRHLVVH